MALKTYHFNRYASIRHDMLDETVRFLSWALKHPQYIPRIPRVRVDSRKEVRFSTRIKVAVWSTMLRAIDKIPYEF
jgi:hypothetical protein